MSHVGVEDEPAVDSHTGEDIDTEQTWQRITVRLSEKFTWGTENCENESGELTEELSHFPAELNWSCEVDWNSKGGHQEFGYVGGDEENVELGLELYLISLTSLENKSFKNNY